MKKCLFISMAVLLSLAVKSQSVIFSDNFDSYTAGGKLVAQAGDTTSWTTWSGGSGGDEDAEISQTVANSGSNSLYIVGDNDIIYRFANQTTGCYKVDFKMYVPSSGNGAYLNVQHDYSPGIEWAFEMYFYNSGSQLYVSYGDNESTNFSFTNDEWFDVSFVFNLDKDSVYVSIGENSVFEDVFSKKVIDATASTDGICKLGSVNFCGYEAEYYIDDFVFTEIVEASIPEFAVSPSTPILLAADDTSFTRTLTLSNTGSAAVNYRIVPTFSTTAQTNTSLDNIDSVSYYNAASISRMPMSMPEGVVLEAAIRIPSERLQSCLGGFINYVMVELRDSLLETAKLKIYGTGNLVTPGPGTLLHSQVFTPKDGFNLIAPTAPIYVDGGDIWVSIEIDQQNETTSGIYIDLTTEGFNDNSYWYKNGVAWKKLTEIDSSMAKPFMIDVAIAGTSFDPWMSISNVENTINAGGDTTASVIFSETAASATENRTAKINVYSDDLNKVLTVIDVTITVSVNEFNNVEISVFPNPSSEYVNLIANGLNKVEIYNFAGQRVFVGDYSSNSAIIKTSDFEAGVYFVKVNTIFGATTQKIVIK